MRSRAAVLLSLVLVVGCKKASTADVLDGGESAALTDTAMGGASEAGSAGGSGAEAAPSASAVGSAAGSAEAGGASADPASAAKDPNPSAPGAPAGVVEFVAINANGGTSDATLKAALDKAKSRYRGCYGKALATDSSTQGTLKLRATIASDGLVEKVEVIGGNLGLSPLVQCSVATTKSLKIAGAAAPATKATFDVKFSK